MKIVENLLLKACGYTIAILFSFYLIGSISNFTNPYINFSTFMLILLFGVLISLAGLILKIKAIHMAFRVIIHYLTLLAAFIAIFILSGNISAAGPAAIFSAIIIFSFFYAVFFAVAFLISVIVKHTDKGINKKVESLPKKPQNKKYQSLYNKED